MTDERRRHKRYDILAQMRVKRDDNTYILSVENISRSGIFVSTEPSDEFPGFALDQELEMTLFTTYNPKPKPGSLRAPEPR